MKKPATIKDIARIAGVSRSTVSRVLTNHQNVKKATAQKVRKAMREVDYQPNVLARGLATGRLNLVSMLLSETENPFYVQMMERMDATLRERGYILSICCLGRTDTARRDTLRTIQQYGFAGFIIGDIKNEPEFIAEVRQIRSPLVFCNRYIETLSEFDAVIVDNYYGGYLAGKHLLELGHRDIATVTGPLRSSASRDRFHGFRDALTEAGIDLSPQRVEEGDLTIHAGEAFAERYLGRNDISITAVFAGNDAMAMGILNFCRARNISVPSQISVVGFDDMNFAASSLVNLTTVQQPHGQMSALTVERIVARIEGDISPRRSIMLEPRLIVRGTTAPVI